MEVGKFTEGEEERLLRLLLGTNFPKGNMGASENLPEE